MSLQKSAQGSFTSSASIPGNKLQPLHGRLWDFLAAAEAMHYLTVVSHVDIALQAVQEGIFFRVQDVVVDNKGVKIVAGFEAAHLAEEAAGTLGGNPEDFRQGEEGLAVIQLVMHLANLDGIDQHAEHVKVVASADVAAQPHPQAFGPSGPQNPPHVEVYLFVLVSAWFLGR